VNLNEIINRELPVIDIANFERIADIGTSKGVQTKWYGSGLFVKKEYLGYESVAETVTSFLLSFSNLLPEEYVIYRQCQIQQGSQVIGKGCFSRDFRKPGEIFIPFGRLLKMHNKPLDCDKAILEEVISRYISCEELDRYLNVVFSLDTIILNEDRHVFNLGLVNSGKAYKPAPIFDNGFSLLSDIMEFLIELPNKENMEKVKAKPFDKDFLINRGDKPVILELDYESLMENIPNEIEDPAFARAVSVLKERLTEMENKVWRKKG